MSEYALMDDVNKWSANDVADHLRKKGLGDYMEIFIKNNIDGEVVDSLGADNLKEMGVSKIGDRIKILKSFNAIRTAKTYQEFDKKIWEGEEVLYVTCCDKLCSTCCCLCPEDPSTYELTSNHMIIKQIDPCRFFCIRCGCCEGSYAIDNVDLSQVVDVDIKGLNPSCFQRLCCGRTVEKVFIKTYSNETKILILGKQDGQPVANKIKLQVEMMQRMERS